MSTIPQESNSNKRGFKINRGVSEVANELKQQGIIGYERGKITILNRRALEVACQWQNTRSSF